MKTSLHKHTFGSHPDFGLCTITRDLWLVMFLVAGFSATGAETPVPASAAFNEAVVMSPAESSLTGTNSAGGLDDKHRLTLGDKISFQILEDLDDPKETLDPKSLVVADDGEIEVPYIGRVRAESKTCKQLAVEIKTALEKNYYYQATVRVAIDLKAKSRGRIYLVGPVRTPGAQEIPSDEVLTLSKAIMRAGSFNDFADKKNVKVTRKVGPGERDTKTFVVDVAQILEKGQTAGDLPLEPGDLVVIPERAIRF
jgi:protein involved in polysaccharide export with SLBB domain